MQLMKPPTAMKRGNATRKMESVNARFSVSEQCKGVFSVVDDTLAFELSDFCRESAALDLEVVCKLLAVKRDVKGGLAALLCHNRKIGEQLFAS